MGTLNIKVGDKVIFKSSVYGSGEIEQIATVIKITPTGRIKIDLDDHQFTKDGHVIGNKNSRRILLLSEASEEDIARIAQSKAIRRACQLCDRVNTQNITYEQALKLIEILEPEQ